MHDGVANLSRKVFYPSHVQDDPLLHNVGAMHVQKDLLEDNTAKKGKLDPPTTTSDLGEKGTLLIGELCQKGENIIYGMHIMNIDVSSYTHR